MTLYRLSQFLKTYIYQRSTWNGGCRGVLKWLSLIKLASKYEEFSDDAPNKRQRTEYTAIHTSIQNALLHTHTAEIKCYASERAPLLRASLVTRAQKQVSFELLTNRLRQSKDGHAQFQGALEGALGRNRQQQQQILHEWRNEFTCMTFFGWNWYLF